MNTERRTLLILEDEEPHVEAIRRALEKAGTNVEIRAVGTLREFRACVAERMPDLALIDLNLPDGRAVEVLTHPPETAPFPILVMTAFGNQETVVEVMKAGALDYVVKSTETFAAMPQTLERVFREWKLLQKHKQVTEEVQSAKAFLDSIINAIADPVFVKDDKRRFVLVNEALCEIVGRTKEQLIGEVGDDMFPKDQVEVFKKMDAVVMDTGEENVNEESLNNLVTGGVRTIITRKTRYIDPNGKRFLVGVIRDFTERKRAEETLRESMEQFRLMFEMASIGMAQADPQTGQWLRVNQKMCAITGYSAGELLRMRVLEITHPADRQKDGGAFQRVVRGESPEYSLEKRYVRKDGTVAWVNVNMTVLRDAAGQPTRTMATIEDITERKRGEEQMAKQIEELRRWHEVTLGRETRVLGLKREVNDLLAKAGQPPRYSRVDKEVGTGNAE